MKKNFLFLLLLLAAGVSAQKPVLLDTLNAVEKTALQGEYAKKNATFLTGLDNAGSKKEVKALKDIFEDSYEDLDGQIADNRLFEYSDLNRYLNKILSEIKEKNANFPQDINLLVSREYEANAYSTGEGTIVLNNYLLNSLDNEDELAYIICHEGAHQSLQHALNAALSYVRENNSQEIKGKTKQLQNMKYNQATQAENLLKDLVYKNSKESRRREIEADSLGFLYYMQLKRNLQQPLAALEKLTNSDNEDDSLTVDDYKKLFSAPELHFNAEWFNMDDYSMYFYKESTKFNTDSLRTHPNIEERIAALKKSFPQLLNKEDATPVRVSEDFTKWRSNAVYQNIYNEFVAKHYGNSLYEALKLYNRKPDAWLKSRIGQNFQALYEAQKNYRLNRYISQVNVHEYTKSYNLFCTFVNNLRLGDFKAFADYFSR